MKITFIKNILFHIKDFFTHDFEAGRVLTGHEIIEQYHATGIGGTRKLSKKVREKAIKALESKGEKITLNFPKCNK